MPLGPMEQLDRLAGPLPGSQGQNLTLPVLFVALTVVYVALTVVYVVLTVLYGLDCLICARFERGEPDAGAAAHVEGADTLGAVDLVPGEGLRVSGLGTYKTVKAIYKTAKATYKTVKATYKTVKVRFWP